MRVVVTGGGSGGHVTPLKPIIQDLHRQDPSVEVLYIGQKKDPFAKTITSIPDLARSTFIRTGKYRRYPNESTLKRLFDVKTNVLNFIDIFRTLIAFIKCLWILARFKPDVVFGKGGFVSVPVAYAAKMKGVPVVIHESDSRLGMANRSIAKFAEHVLVGMPMNMEQPVEGKKFEFVGVPLQEEYTTQDGRSKDMIKSQLGFNPDYPLITAVGGSLGAATINKAVVSSLQELESIAQVALVAGERNVEDVKLAIRNQGIDASATMIVPYTNQLHLFFKASDLVIARASATVFAELSALKRASIIVPAKQLGDQTTNAMAIEAQNAAIVVTDDELAADPRLLYHVARAVLKDEQKRSTLEANMAKLSSQGAAQRIAAFILQSGLDASRSQVKPQQQ